MISSMITSFGSFLLSICKFLLWLLVFLVVPALTSGIVYFIYYWIKFKKIPKRKVKRKFKYNISFTLGNFLNRIFLKFPERKVLDFFELDPDSFDTFGVHLFCGEQGSGKSIAAVHFMKCIKERNPLSKLCSNINLDFMDSSITSWEDILSNNNGIYGQIVFLDEIQNWFSSMESKNFPPEMLTEITQQRKQRKIVVGTSQVFTRVAKPLREQVTLLYKPVTLFGCITFVSVYKVGLSDDGTVDKMVRRKTYFFVHDKELREAYNTYDKVERLARKGFKSPNDNYLYNRAGSNTIKVQNK